MKVRRGRLVIASVATLLAVAACAQANTGAAHTPATPSAARAKTAVTAYVVVSSNAVVPIDTATNIAGTPITVGSVPDAIAIAANGNTAYVANSASNTVTPIDIDTNTAGAPIPIGKYPVAIAVTPDGKTVYVATAAGLIPIDTATHNAGKAIPLSPGPWAIAITPDGKTVYVANTGWNTVTSRRRCHRHRRPGNRCRRRPTSHRDHRERKDGLCGGRR